MLHARIEIACTNVARSILTAFSKNIVYSPSCACGGRGGGLKVLTTFYSYALITIYRENDT